VEECLHGSCRQVAQSNHLDSKSGDLMGLGAFWRKHCSLIAHVAFTALSFVAMKCLPVL